MPLAPAAGPTIPTGTTRRAVRARSLVAALCAIGLTATACSEGVPDIDTTDAEAALGEIVATSGFPEESTFAALDACPIAQVDVLLDQVFAEADGEALEATTVAFVSAPNERPDGDPYLGCGRLDATTGVGVLFTVADAPGDGLADPGDAEVGDQVEAQWDGIVDAYALRFGDLAGSVDTRRLRDTRGGTLHRICISEPDVPERDSCEAAWFGGDLVVSAVVTGPGSLDADTGILGDELRRRLQLIVDGLDAG